MDSIRVCKFFENSVTSVESLTVVLKVTKTCEI
jgi:hypothetical protein